MRLETGACGADGGARGARGYHVGNKKKEKGRKGTATATECFPRQGPEQPAVGGIAGGWPQREGSPEPILTVRKLSRRSGDDGAAGSVRWMLQDQQEFRGSATIDPKGYVYVGNESGRLYKLDPQSGEPQWVFDCCEDQPTPEFDERRGGQRGGAPPA